jgi:tyrosine aminotransferase
MSTQIPASHKAARTTNPIRKIVDNLNPDPHHKKSLLNLALGDPTIHGPHLQCPIVLNEAVNDLLMSNSANGYLPSVGCPPARKAIAHATSLQSTLNNTDNNHAHVIKEDDIIITSGCSGAVELAITVLLNEGTNSNCD